MQFRSLIFVFLVSFGTTLFAQNIKHTIYFGRNSSALNKLDHQSLDGFIKQLDTIAIDSIGINGYSDYLGKSSYNLVLSKKRAQRVYNHLKQFDSDILRHHLTKNTSVIGNGEIYTPLTPPQGIPKHRKVEIILYATPKKYVINKTQKVRKFVPEEGMKFNQLYVLEKVYFVGNEPELLEASIPQLEDFYNQIKQIKTEFKLVIKGHICCLEDNATEDDKLFSRTLSTARALRIQDYLVKKGIPKEYIEYRGYSFDDPLIFPELTDDDRQLNRRVEAIVYK